MKKGLAVLLCLCIAFLPAIASAGAGTKIPGFDKSFLPPLPKPRLPGPSVTHPKLNLTVAPKLPGRMPTQPKLDLKVAPKDQPQEAASLNIASVGASSSAGTVSAKPALEALDTKLQEVSARLALPSLTSSPAKPKLDLTPAAKKTTSGAVRTSSALAASAKASSSTTAPCSAQDCPPQAMPDGSVPNGYNNVNISSITYATNPNGGGTLDVEQNAPKAIQNWLSFNVASNWTVNFGYNNNPKATNWVILNRIWDQNPSTIFGKITETGSGSVYLINQNGILFKPGSQVDLHTLLASSLNISDPNFMGGVLDFQAQDYQQYLLGPDGQPVYGPTTKYLDASVTNQGNITTDTLGTVLLLGPSVTNDGTINTTSGQIGLAAGADIDLSYVSGGTTTTLAVTVNTAAGDAINTENGALSANTGLIGMYGKDVNQDGTISAVTALKLNGQIQLIASDTVSTGANSITSSPISGSTETADPSFTFNPGQITMSGNMIDLQGAIVAHSGTVNLNAQQRVFVDNGSSIDVSGSWDNKSAAANTTTVQLNSVNLRDDYGQKNGILKGKYITFDNRFGSSIGDVVGALTTQSATALDRSLQGGTVNINSYSGDVIVKQGASVNFSGGGIRFSAGNVTTTELISGGKIYDISNAPEYLHYDNMLNVTRHVGAYVQGSNAGSLNIIQAKQVTLDGSIKGSATTGVYQTATSELTNSMGEQKTLGAARPVGGTLVIGGQPDDPADPYIENFYIDQVIIKPSGATLPAGFGPTDNLYTGFSPSILSAAELSAAGLSTIVISSNTSITTQPGALIALQPGGSFSAYARIIDHEGKIVVPAGKINLTAIDNFTSFTNELDGSINPAYIALSTPSRVYLGDASVLFAAGETVDNSYSGSNAGGAPLPSSLIQGGQINVKDDSWQGEGVFMKQGALIDVSGGYQIDTKGKLTGGNAGSLGVQGSAILLDGNLRGYSLIGNNGGQITLTAANVILAPSAPSLPANFNSNSGLPADLKGELVFASNSLDQTGFTQIAFGSMNNLTVQSGTTVSPSLMKLATPTPGQTVPAGLVSVSPDLIGVSSFKAAAGILFENHDPNAGANGAAEVATEAGSTINVGPGNGSISISAPIIDLAGLLSAPSGKINVSASNNLTVESGSSILARGYNRQDTSPIIKGMPLGFTALAGGAVTLAAGNELILQSGSLVDVSGSTPVTTYVLSSNGTPVTVTVAGNPGSISLSASTRLTLDGNLNGRAQLAGLQGGSLTIAQSNLGDTFTIYGNDLSRYIADGFDALKFVSDSSLTLSGSMNLSIGRSLTFDAPAIIGLGSDSINLQAPQIELTNSYFPPQGQAGAGSAQLNLSGAYLDISGSLNLSGFGSVKLSSAHDLTLTEKFYQIGTNFKWGGSLNTAANLTMLADRIYPAMQPDNTPSDFTITSSGTVTTLPGNNRSQDPIYSAGGSLTIQAAAIDNEGFLAAPMGSITLTAVGGNGQVGRVYIAEGSTLTTEGNTAVSYGTLNDVFWTVPDKAGQTANNNSSLVTTVQAVPPESVTINGQEVIVRNGANINVSGGGSIFSYQFLAGIQGSSDPFQGKYVIVPNGAYSLPGQAVYLQGVPGIPAGTYSILPEQYAFLPGAMIVTPLGTNVTSGTREVSSDGFPVVAGYTTYSGTSARPPLMEAFEVQPASYVLTQGQFNISGIVAGNAGKVSLTGKTTVVDGTIMAKPLAGKTGVSIDGTALATSSVFQGGLISLSGTNAFIENSTSQLPSDFNFDTPVTNVPGLAGTLHIAAGSLSGKGFAEIDIGNIDSTKGSVTSTIEMVQDTVLSAANVVLSAQAQITLDSGATINTASAGVFTPTGVLDMEQGSVINASNHATMQIGKMGRGDFKGNLLQSGFWGGVNIGSGGTLNLTGQNVYFMRQYASLPQNPDSLGLYVPYDFWKQFGSINNVNLTATSGTVGFLGDMSLLIQDSITNSIITNSIKINAATITESNAGSSGVVIDGPNLTSIWLLNTTGVTPGNPNAKNGSSLTLNASEIWVGEGPMLLDGFSSVSFKAQNDITFLGNGSLSAVGDLNFLSARVTTSYYTDAITPYTAANFKVSTAGNVNIGPPENGVAAPGDTVPGGTLEIDGNSIDVSGVIQMASGILRLNGVNGITVDNPSGASAQILDKGSFQQVNGQTVYSPGGSIYLNSTSGVVAVKNGSVDVSGAVADNYAYDQTNKVIYSVYTAPSDTSLLDAGTLSIYSSGSAILRGTLNGAAGYWKSSNGTSVINGSGGSFALNAEDLSSNSSLDKGFSALSTILTNGGFTENIDVRLRGMNSQGSTMTVGDTINVRNFNLTADNWSIDFSGKIDSTALGGGGTIQFNSGRTLTLTSTSQILSPGATVLLNTADGAPGQSGYVNFYGLIDVTGQSGQTGGTVHFRALQNGSDANFNLQGIVNGASLIEAEAVRAYNYNISNGLTINISNSNTYIGAWKTDAATYMSSANLTQNNLTSNTGSLKLVSGVEVTNTGDITLGTAWDFTNTGWDNIGPGFGFVTLRAQGNLNINANLVDHPSGVLTSAPGTNSWGLNLVAGADLSSANALSIKTGTGTGNLAIANGTMVYSESAPIRFAAANNMSIGQGANNGYIVLSTIPYNLGTYNGSIQGVVGGKLSIMGGAIETATGDIDIDVGGDLALTGGTSLGSIRTTGQPVEDTFYQYAGGGNITLQVGGMVAGGANNLTNTNQNAWDYANGTITPKVWSANYNGSTATEGLATMGGGSLVVYSGGSFYCQAGTFGTGDLTIYSGGDIRGRFLVEDGSAELHAMANFGHPLIKNAMGQVVQAQEFESIEAFNARIDVSAQGSVLLGTVLNPTLVGSSYALRGDLNMTYSPDSSVSLTAVTGDVTITGVSPFTHLTGTNVQLQQVLPATLEIYAGGNINLENSLALAPSPSGNLVMVAGGNIDGSYTASNGAITQAGINVSDLDPNSVYGYQKKLAVANLFNAFLHDSSPLHAGDASPVEIHAGGNIEDVQFFVPKSGVVTAGGDIRDIYYFGQNVSPTDETKIMAAGNIEFSYILGGSTNNTGIQLAGPGSLEVQAGGSIDLGTSGGIRTVGNAYNPALGSDGSSITVISGYNTDISNDQETAFFNELQTAGSNFSLLMSEEAEQYIAKFFSGAQTNGTGDINMVSSQISTSSANSDIFIFNKGALNVGLTTFFANESQVQSTGIYTAGGGGINIFSVGNLNVNESRIMTFFGGDITVWSDEGNVNAGRGSKTTVNASPPKLVYNSATRTYNLVFSPPAVGSGIRAVTYAPGFGQQAPLAGNINLFAPKGTVDAGEAGIAGRKIRIVAVAVLNAGNIIASAGSVGVPSGAANISGLTALSGVGNVTQTMQTQEASMSAAAGNKLAQAIAATAAGFITTALEVKVLSVFDVDPGESSWEKTDN